MAAKSSSSGALSPYSGPGRHSWPGPTACADRAFLLFNAASGIVWATLYRLGGYLLGDNVHRLAGPIGIVTVVLAVLLILAAFVIVRRNEQRLADEAERALPEQEGNMEVAQDFV